MTVLCGILLAAAKASSALRSGLTRFPFVQTNIVSVLATIASLTVRVVTREVDTVIQALTHGVHGSHIRPFMPHQDLAELATLVERSFGPELETTGSYIVQDLREMAALAPFLRATMSILVPFTGFVWLEDGHIVGNVSLAPEKGVRGSWTVSNVAVLPEWRGRGIAGSLMDSAISFARQQGARRLLLQVRADNAPAQALYLHRGFRIVDTIHEMILGRPVSWALEDAPSSIMPLAPRDRAEVMHVLQATGSPATISPRIMRHLNRSRLGWFAERTTGLLTWERDYECVAKSAGRLVAYGYAITNALRGPHEMGLFALPEERGRWERAMMVWLLGRLQKNVPQPVRTTISDEYLEALDVAGRFGFRTVRVLDEMVLDLSAEDAEDQDEQS